MPKFRKRPVVIDAWPFEGSYESYAAIPSGGMCQWKIVGGGSKSQSLKRGVIDVQTLEGVMRAEPGDYIIRGITGEFYPCKLDIFEATYEAVEEAPDA